MSTQEFQSLRNVILTAGQDLLDRSQTGSVFLPLDETNYVAVGTLAGILHVAGKEFPAEPSTTGAAKGGITSLEGLTRYGAEIKGGGYGEDYAGMCVDALGDYYLISDVERLLASTAVEQKEPLSDAQIDEIARQEGDEDKHGFIFNKDGRHSIHSFARAVLATQAAPASPEHVKADVLTIPSAIMSINVDPRQSDEYKRGHRDARHDAADLVLARADELLSLAAPSSATPAAPEQVQTDAARDVLAERRRQIEVEGWTAERDDGYINCELARAAATYATCSHIEQLKLCGEQAWPWHTDWWKRSTYRRDLTKAGALILAEIERLDRDSMKRQAISEGEKGGASDA